MILKKLAQIFIILLFFLGCDKEIVKKDFTLKGFVFGTTYKIDYLNADKSYQKSIDSLFILINNSVSTYIETSAISKINNGNTSILVDDIFEEVFLKSKKINRETNGYFDPTVGNLVNAYGFGPKESKKNLTSDEIKNQMQFVGLDKVILKNRQIIKEHQNIYLDFNSIAKGYALDLVSRFLDDKKIENYLIEIGGEIKAKGSKENNQPWRIKIVNPADVTKGFTVINISDKAMATSGNYRKFRITDAGKKYVHTINPKTGLAQESSLLSASVIAAKDCADLDAYATAFMAMGLEKTKAFLKNHPDLKVVLLYSDNTGNIIEYATYTYK